MKLYSLALLVVVVFASCNSSEKKKINSLPVTSEAPSYEKMEALSWVLGGWDNVNEDSQSYERWEKENDSLYIAMSITMKDGDTIFAERMRLFQNGGIVGLYVETLGEEPNPVVFTQVPNAEYSFTFENVENEFPSQIIYTQPENNRLHAWVSGTIDGAARKVDFYFDRQN